MDELKHDAILLVIDEELAPKISTYEAQALKPIQKKFMESYLEHRDTMPIDEWLRIELAESLPECSDEEIT